MSGYLLYGRFNFLKNVDNFDVNSVSKNSPIGYILEVDLEYPDELHVLARCMSNSCKNIADQYGIKVGDVKQLISNLGNRTNYMLHYRNLQLHLSLRMKLANIRRVLKFKQSDWIKKYIDFNTEKRTNTANIFEKDFFKLMINSVSGKTMENLKKIMNVTLVSNEKDFVKYTSRPTHITHKTFGKNYAAIHEMKPILMLNKPIYVGFTVLELSKWLMYDFHHNFIEKRFDFELLFTETDSLTYEIKSEDVYEEHFKHKHFLDFSNYQKDSKFFDQANKNIVGKMKDESEGKIIGAFVGLKSKMYSMKNIDDKESNTAKGVNIATEFNEFKNTLFNKKIVKMRRIQGKRHKMGTFEVNKISLSCFDDKRFVLDNGIHTLAYFHKDLKKQIHPDDHK